MQIPGSPPDEPAAPWNDGYGFTLLPSPESPFHSSFGNHVYRTL